MNLKIDFRKAEIPEFQGKGIGTAAMEFAKSYYKDWKEFTLCWKIRNDKNEREQEVDYF